MGDYWGWVLGEEGLFSQTSEYLSNFAHRNEFFSELATAFGSDYELELATQLQQTLLNGEFLSNLEIQLLPSATLQGALGAYASENNTIYLSQELLVSSPQQASSVLLEEVGHAIDQFLNLKDSAGDEGAIFASLVQREALSDQELTSLREEDDRANLEINGETIVVEQAEFTVSNASDSGEGSLRQAIVQANTTAGADTITFESSLSGQIINLTSGQLNITDALTIEGLGQDELTLDAGSNSRIFKIDDGNSENAIEVTIDGLTLTGGNIVEDNGGGIFNSENLTLSNSTVSGNSASSDPFADSTQGARDGGSGGGIYNPGTLNLSNSTISGNSASAGGGISVWYGTASIINSTISNNSIDEDTSFNDGGGMSIFGTVQLTNSTISGNSARNHGGGIYVDDTGYLTASNSTISGNSAYEGGGLYGRLSFVNANVSNSIISGNESTRNDGVGNEILGSIASSANNLFGNSSQTNAQAFGTYAAFTPGVNDITATSDGTNPTAFSDILDSAGLKNNGGLTETIALADNSPAIDAGDNALLSEAEVEIDFNGDGDTEDTLETDQRGDGFDRVVNGTVDLGAVEVQDGGGGAPTANDESFSFLGVPEQSPLIFDVLENDISNDGSVLEITDFPTTTDQGGTLELDDQSQIIYTPSPEFTQGVDSFTYTITNESGGTDQATVEVAFSSDVNEPPTIDSVDIFDLDPEFVFGGEVVGEILASDPNGDPLIFNIVEGNNDLDGDGELPFVIAPLEDDFGAIFINDSDDLQFGDSFNLTVEVSDGELTDVEEIAIALTSSNTAPIIEDATLNIEAPVVNDDFLGFLSAFDSEGDELTFAIVQGNPDLDDDGESAFTIDPFTSDIFVNDSDEIDFDSNPTFNLTVEVSDGELTDTGEITINFTNEPDPGIEEQEPNDTIANAIATGITPENQEPFRASGVIGNNPNVSPELDFDIYAFDLAIGDRVTIDIDAESIGSELDSFLEIFDDSGNSIVFNDDEINGTTLDSFLTYTPTVSGTFYAAVGGFFGTGNYEIDINVNSVVGGADEPNDTLDTAIFTELSSANPGRFNFSGNIGDNANLIVPNLDVDLFEVQLDAGDSLTAAIDTSELATSFDSVLRIFDQNGNEVAFNDDNNETLDSFIEFTADVSSRYLVGVSGFGNETYFPSQAGSGVVGSTGDYNLELVVNDNQQEGTNEPNDLINNAVDTRELLSSTGEFLAQGVIGDNNNLSNLGKDVDLYRVVLTQGENIAIDLDTPASSSLDLILRVFNANGKEIDTNDDGNAPEEQLSLDPFLNFTAPTSGTYYVGISDLANDLYSPYSAESGLDAGATGTYTLEIEKTGLSFTFDQTLREGESNQLLGSRPRNETRETALEISLDEAETDEIGDNIDYTTVPGLDVDFYTLSLEENQKVTIEVNSSDVGFDSVLRLFNSVGEEIAFNDDFGVGTDSQIEITIPDTGEYFIGVSGYGNENYDPDTAGSGAPFASTGSYQLTVTEEETAEIIAGAEEENDTLANATATNLTPNNRGNFKQTNAIGNNVSLEEVGLDVDLLRVVLDNNTRVTANINTANFDSNFDSLLRLFDSQGEQVAFNDDENSDTNDSFLEFVPEQAGTYYVGVSGLGNEAYNPNTPGSGNSGTVGDYEIEINLSEAIAEETPSNDTLTTAIKAELTNNRFTRSGFIGDNSNVQGDVDFYQVALEAQDILTIEIEGEALGSNLESFLRLFNGDGEEIDLNYDARDFPDPELTVTIPEDDTYTIGVSAFGNDEYDPTVAGSGSAETTGEYELNLQLERPIPAAQAAVQEIRPTVNNDTDLTNSNDAITIDVLNNDTANDDQGVLEIVNFPETTDKGGTIELDNDSRLVYTPDSEFAGVDTFTYTASNESGGSAQGTVEVTVNRPPEDANVQVSFEIRAIPGQQDQLDNGLQIGDEFLVDVRFQDLFTENAQGVTFGYADLIFDPNVVKVVTDNNSIDNQDSVVDGIIRNSDYTLGRKGTVRNAQGLVDRVGAGTFASRNNPPEDDLVFSVHMEAVGGGNTAILGSRANQENDASITILGALADQRSRTNFGEINLAEGSNSEEAVNAFAASLNNNINLQDQGIASVAAAISAMEVNVEFQDDNGTSLEQVAVGDSFNIVLSAKDLRPEGQKQGVFSAFADIEYDTVLVDVNNAALNDPFTSPVLSLADVIDEGKGVVNALGGTNANFTAVGEEMQEFAVLTATATAPGTLNVGTNSPEAETAINTLFGVDADLNDGTIYGENTLTITGEVSSDADLVVTQFDAVIDHVLGGETEINLTVENQGGGNASGFQLEVLYYRADSLDALATETPTVVETLAFDSLSAGETATLENQAISLPLEALLEEALADDPSIFGEEIPEEGVTSNNIDFLGVRIVDNVSTNENQAAFENNGVDGTKGVNVDDITFFPWDFLNNDTDGVVQGGEDNLISDGEVTGIDANAVFGNIGRLINPNVTEDPNSGLDLDRIDFDLDGAISPVDAVRVVNRLGYEINPTVFEEMVG